MKRVAVLACLVSSTVSLDSNLYFYVTENVPKCFTEDLPADTIILGSYKHETSSVKPAFVRVYDPVANQVYEEKADKVGRFAHHASVSGSHKICIESDGSSWPTTDKTAKFHLKLEIHGSMEISEDTAKKEHFSKLEMEIQELQDKVDLVLRDIEYSKQKESHFRDQSERINGHIFWWSTIQSILLILSGLWQIIHLKEFFRAKKLV